MGRRAYTIEDWKRRIADLEKEYQTAAPRRRAGISATLWKIRRELAAPAVDPIHITEKEYDRRRQRAIKKMWSPEFDKTVTLPMVERYAKISDRHFMECVEKTSFEAPKA